MISIWRCAPVLRISGTETDMSTESTVGAISLKWMQQLGPAVCLIRYTVCRVVEAGPISNMTCFECLSVRAGVHSPVDGMGRITKCCPAQSCYDFLVVSQILVLMSFDPDLLCRASFGSSHQCILPVINSKTCSCSSSQFTAFLEALPMAYT
jgi:hypothetical protein